MSCRTLVFCLGEKKHFSPRVTVLHNANPKEQYVAPETTVLLISNETPILQGSTGFTTTPWGHDSDTIG